MTDWIKVTSTLWSGFEHGLSAPLPHVGLAGVNPLPLRASEQTISWADMN
ncbi:hypothetical protein [Bifidobacterium bifidum]|uniref:Uncharacterized protein n=1 Tax=Bifidobacterium bifidum BGN4 TaxID=484020 RepID=I3WFJ2_BIFBI|nr:hypothetical protein [Bifidobacterium bifidum]AFL03655.1 hypothetical protein BBB_0058 [Bifidobacterium bifidum BGN4]MDB1198366.1 hypothetical protein [Bifidobacterium bifidum]MDB1201025.1 hypothetical protein [Bifidobacterium bifidum]MDB1205197.1 hypothetical protein [Bifidobacterium bifidum]MDB1205288.1 hypothetical protein [Bifidobacterium bifidum]